MNDTVERQEDLPNKKSIGYLERACLRASASAGMTGVRQGLNGRHRSGKSLWGGDGRHSSGVHRLQAVGVGTPEAV